ncbi:MAG: flagellar motor switch protein FliG, partial [Candidatus Eremiobacteraeota bacterium]|nr:flagellar motor switch protein FliG [Candidatus Eremiobacteraeota bacterium]
VEQNILQGFEEEEPELAEEIKKRMFVFDDLVLLDDRAFQKVLKEVDGKILALAMRRASKEIVELIHRNLSERARNILKEDVASMGKVRVRDVDKAQTEIVNIVRRLEESGEINVSREDEKFV